MSSCSLVAAAVHPSTSAGAAGGSVASSGIRHRVVGAARSHHRRGVAAQVIRMSHHSGDAQDIGKQRPQPSGTAFLRGGQADRVGFLTTTGAGKRATAAAVEVRSGSGSNVSSRRNKAAGRGGCAGGVKTAAATLDGESSDANVEVAAKKKSKGGELMTRIASSLFMGAIGVYVVFTGGLVWSLWMSVGSWFAAKEYFGMAKAMRTELPSPPPDWASTTSIAMCAAFSLLTHLAGGQLSTVVMVTIAAFTAISFLLILQDEPHFSQFTTTLFGIFYCGFLPSFWVKLRGLAGTVPISSTPLVGWPEWAGGADIWTLGLTSTLITILCIVSADVGAYAFGKTFGRHKLIAVSPNKTIEGALGGLATTMGMAFLLKVALGWPAGVLQTLLLGAVTFCASVFGDLVESVMKRNAGMKDSGNIIPGHGGFLDRFDSYMFTGSVVYFYIFIILKDWMIGVV